MKKQRFVYVQDPSEAVAGEVLGTGDGATVTFTGALAQDNIARGSLSLTDGTQAVTDDGAGNLTGDGSGTIAYDTGDYSVTFNAAPVSGASVTADYDYHPTVDFTTSLSGMQWLPGSKGVGGIEFSAARIPSSYELRRDRTLRQTLRFSEAEWAAIEKLLEHGQRGTLITVYPDASSAASRACYLTAPAYEEEILPRPSDYPGHLEIDVEWVDSTGTGWAAFQFYG